MSTEDVIKKLAEYDINPSVRTLQRWVKDGLLPKPEHGSYGQGRGTWANYPDETVPEALTAHLLRTVYKLTLSKIAEARKGYKEGNKRFFTDTYIYYLNRINKIKKGQDFASILHNAEDEKEGFTNAEHTLEFFRKHGHRDIRTMKDLFMFLENNPKKGK